MENRYTKLSPSLLYFDRQEGRAAIVRFNQNRLFIVIIIINNNNVKNTQSIKRFESEHRSIYLFADSPSKRFSYVCHKRVLYYHKNG